MQSRCGTDKGEQDCVRKYHQNNIRMHENSTNAFVASYVLFFFVLGGGGTVLELAFEGVAVVSSAQATCGLDVESAPFLRCGNALA